MFRALLWKEWRQLRMLRWGGIALGIVLPPAIAAGAEIARRGGGMGFGADFDYTARDLYGSALPAILALGVWPLMALVFPAQSFAGDRSGGTESFLLERPVARSRVFGARLLGSAGSVVLVVAGTLLVAVAAAALSSVSLTGMPRAMAILGAGLAVTAAVFLGGVLAGTLLAAPLAAVLLGLLLIAAPAWMVSQLEPWTSFVIVGGVPFAMLPPVALLLAYPLVAWYTAARGEPAGKGRVMRGVALLTLGLALVPAVTLAGSPLILRWQAHRWSHGEAHLSPVGGPLVLLTEAGGWLADPATASRTAYLGSRVADAAWSRDGSLLALTRWSGSGMELSIIDAQGREVGRPEFVDAAVDLRGWLGDLLVLVVWKEPLEVRLLSARGGQAGGFVLPEDARPLMISHGPDRLWVVRRSGKQGEEGPYAVHIVDAATGRIAEQPAVTDVGRGYAAWLRLSPSGRWWIREGRPEGPLRLVELASGREVELAGTEGRTFVRWLPGDRLAVTVGPPATGRLLVGPPEGPLAEVASGPYLVWAASPDGARLVVSERAVVADARDEMERTFRVLRQRVIPIDGGPAVEVPAWPDRASRVQAAFTGWAGNRTLARDGEHGLAFESLDTPGKRVCVLGDCEGWAD